MAAPSCNHLMWVVDLALTLLCGDNWLQGAGGAEELMVQTGRGGIECKALSFVVACRAAVQHLSLRRLSRAT